MNFSDRIKGAVFGMALGDALGLGTEFMTAEEVKFHYPDGLRRFSDIIRDSHRCMWKRGEVSNDTRINLIILNSIMERGAIDTPHIAHHIKARYNEDPHDFPEFYSLLMSHPEWVEQPLQTSHRIWRDNHLWMARNEALPRAIVTGILGFPRLIGNTLDTISLTHSDTRCTCCGVVIATMADALLRTGEPTTYDHLCHLVHTHDSRVLHALERSLNGEVKDLELDDPDNLWQTRKCMAAGLWPIWHNCSPEETVEEIINAGGDADTNGAVAMGLIGLRDGFDALPEEKYNLVDFKEIEETADRFVKFMEKYEAAKETPH